MPSKFDSRNALKKNVVDLILFICGANVFISYMKEDIKVDYFKSVKFSTFFAYYITL